MEQLTLYPGDSPASHSASPANDRAARITVSSGLRLCVSLTLSGPAGSYLKTLLASSAFWNRHHFLEWRSKRLSFFVRAKQTVRQKSSSDSSEESLQPSLSKSGQLDIYFPHLSTARQSLVVFQLVVSAPRTGGTAFGLLPTPTATYRRESAAHWASRYQQGGRRPKSPTLIVAIDLLIQAARTQELAKYAVTGRYQERAKPLEGLTEMLHHLEIGLFPTPTATDAKGSASPEGLTRKGGRSRADSLRNIPAITGLPGQLSPLFVAEMMGFPVNWTVSAFQNGGRKASMPSATP